MNRKLLICAPLFAIPFLMAHFSASTEEMAKRFHSDAETAHFNLMLSDTSLPTEYNYLFAGSGVCQKCHGFDTAHIASVDAFGNDINVVDDWRATMMGNSAKDPFWRAKVSHEVALYPQHQEAIEDKCTSCHAPMGHFDAKHLGASHYSIAEMAADPIALDGVSCLACHMQSDQNLGFHFSGELVYDTFKVAYGPFTFPLVSPMLTETGYRPQYSPHISDAGSCAGCHTLITQTLDFEGNATGNDFVEQATYHEWLNSAYKDSLSCQQCHMPEIGKFPVYLVTGAQTEARSPFFLHELVGGNVTMLKLLRDNIDSLDLKASTEQFDDVIAKTENMLQNRSIQLQLTPIDRDLDTARFSVKILNLAGHKFPSGYPARRAFIEFLVKTAEGDTIFISGKTDDEYEVFGQNPTYEPHYQMINSEEQVQIYEMVMGDVNGDVTTVLERADQPIKDNRLPPLGFTTSNAVYDTTRIAGAALNDVDFNKENGAEGSGSDIVYFHVPMNGQLEPLIVSARVFYQPTPPKWMKEMFDHHTPEIDKFRSQFAEVDRSPVLMREAVITVDEFVATRDSKPRARFVNLFPTPSSIGRIFVQSTQPHTVEVFDLKGRRLEYFKNKSGQYELKLKGKGVLMLRFTSNTGISQIEKVVLE